MRLVLRFRLSLLVSLALASSAAARPASAVQPADAPLPLLVVGTGFGYRDDRYAPLPTVAPDLMAGTAVAVLENPNPGAAAEGVRVVLRLRDAADVLLGSSEQHLPQVLPGERRALVHAVMLSTAQPRVARVDVEVTELLRWRATRAVPLLTVHDIRVNPFFHADCFICVPPRGFAMPCADRQLSNPLDAVVGEVLLTGATRLAVVLPQQRQAVRVSTLIYDRLPLGHVELFAAYPWIDLTPYQP